MRGKYTGKTLNEQKDDPLRGGFSCGDIIYFTIVSKENMNEKIPNHRMDVDDSFRLQSAGNPAACAHIHIHANRAGSHIYSYAFCHS
jgi:hypothetical protein